MVEYTRRQYAEAISGLSDGNSDQIGEILRLSNEKDVFYHGVKRRESADIILNEGFNAKTPECGSCSFWTAGLSVFLNNSNLPTKGFATRDTSFFDYGAGKNGTLVVTDGAYFDAVGLKVEKYGKNGQAKTWGHLPVGNFSVLELDVYDDFSAGRESGKFQEQEMASLLKNFLRSYVPGESSYLIKKTVVRNLNGEVSRDLYIKALVG